MDVDNEYSNRTLQGNWWEDRQQEGAGLEARALTVTVRTAARCAPWPALSAEDQRALFRSAQTLADERRMSAPAPAPPPRPAMVTAANAAAALAAQAAWASGPGGSSSGCGESGSGSGGCGCGGGAPTAAAGPTSTRAHEDRFTTAYKRAFEDERRAALASRPRADFEPTKRYPLNGKLRADTWQQGTLCEGPKQAGRGGSRGEFSRRPAESGSRYGVAVFADEYAATGRRS